MQAAETSWFALVSLPLDATLALLWNLPRLLVLLLLMPRPGRSCTDFPSNPLPIPIPYSLHQPELRVTDEDVRAMEAEQQEELLCGDGDYMVCAVALIHVMGALQLLVPCSWHGLLINSVKLD